MSMHVPESHHIQARWSSVIRETVLRDAKLLRILPESETSTARLPEYCHQVMGPLCQQLLEHACQCQVTHPKLVAKIEQRIARDIWNALKAFSSFEFGKHVQIEFELTPHGARALTSRTSNAKDSIP